VRTDKQTVSEDQTVSEEVRKEQIEADGDTADSRGRQQYVKGTARAASARSVWVCSDWLSGLVAECRPKRSTP
jgi:hypothetical protein